MITYFQYSKGTTMKNLSLFFIILIATSFTFSQEEVEVVFDYTGEPQEWVVPPGVTTIHLDIIGASGEGTSPGKAGRVECELTVTSGQLLYLYIGGIGVNGEGGFNGGGSAPWTHAGSTGGGGASDIRIGGTSLDNRVIIAGGGGGSDYGIGGHGGGLTGGSASGDYNYIGHRVSNATGGSEISGGKGACLGNSCHENGSLLYGGDAASYGFGNSGGGGGGYYGGGGGIYRCGGGGGSSYTDDDVCSNVEHTQGYAYTWGKITLTYTEVKVTYVPDDNFETYLEDHGMGDGVTSNNYVLTENIQSIEYLQINGLDIGDLTGIEDFSSLLELRCYNNQLSHLDVSKNTQLQYLDCSGNQITQLDVSENSRLKTLYFSGNDIDKSDLIGLTFVPDDNFEAYLENHKLGNGVNGDNYVLTKNIKGVTDLSVANENISDLTGIEEFTALVKLQCFNNQITDIDVSLNINLQYLDCDMNQLTELNVSSLSALQSLHCRNNQISALDVSNNRELTLLRCYNNQLTELDIRNGNNEILSDFIATGNPNLSCIMVNDVGYATSNFQQIDAHSSFRENSCE